MSAAYGISSFVDGFFQGRNWRNDQEDRKDEKARQKKLDELTFAREARYAEEHNWTMDERRRAAADNAALREAAQADIDAANGALGAVPASGDPAAAPQSAPVDPVTGVAANLGLPLGAIRPSQQGQAPSDMLPAMRVMAGQVMPQPAGPRRATVDPAAGPSERAASLAPVTSPRPQANPAGGVQGGPAFENAGRGGAGAPQQPNGPDFERYGRQVQPAANMPVPQQAPHRQGPAGYTVAPAPSAAIADELYQQGPAGVRYLPNAAPAAPIPAAAGPIPMGIMEPDYSHNWGESGGMLSDIGEAAKRANRAVDAIPRAAAGVVQDAAGITNTVLNPWVKYATGSELPMPPSWQEERSGGATGTFKPKEAAPLAAAPAGVGPLKANLPAGASPKAQAAADSAANAVVESATPATQAAIAAAAPQVEAMGVSPSKGPTKEQEARGVEAFMQHFYKEGSQNFLRELLRQGKIDEAQKYTTFIEEGKSREAIRNWAKAAFAITHGDIDTFAENMIEAYNSQDYYPDGLSIVKEKSRAIKSKDGTDAGYILTFKDDATGNTFEQVFNSQDDLIRAGMILMAPDEAFNQVMAQQEAAKAAALGAQEKADKQASEQNKQVIDLITELMQTTEYMNKPIEEVRAVAEAIVRGKPAAIPGGARSGGAPPVAYRP